MNEDLVQSVITDLEKELSDTKNYLESTKSFISHLEERTKSLEAKIENVKGKINGDVLEESSNMEKLDDQAKPKLVHNKEMFSKLKENTVKFSYRQRTVVLLKEKVSLLKEQLLSKDEVKEETPQVEVKPEEVVNNEPEKKDNLYKPMISFMVDLKKAASLGIKGGNPVTISNDEKVALTNKIKSNEEVSKMFVENDILNQATALLGTR